MHIGPQKRIACETAQPSAKNHQGDLTEMGCLRVIRPLIVVLLFSRIIEAQAPQAPPPLYTGSFGGGLALTSGNTDTTNFNLAFNLTRDPKTKNVIKLNALYLRGDQNDVRTLDRAALNIRDEYTVSGRVFVFGQIDYLRDRFKEINYLLAPTAGVGYKLVSNDQTILMLDAGAGGIWEKNPGINVRKSGILSAGERFSQKVSSTASITQSIATLWKTNDFGDSLTNFAAGLTTSINSRLELKLEFLDSYKNKPPRAGIKKNDTAFVTTFVVKF
jgi:putative salt-induced outer membrane protein YdiY